MRSALCFLPLLAWLAISVAVAQPGGQQTYAIDTEGSDIHWLVYSAGAFSRLGHHHVISVDEFTGAVTLSSTDPAESRFELEIPVASLVVDDPALRARYGEDFASEPSAKDIEGTRGNMLGERVLQANQYPVLRVTGTGPRGTADNQTFEIEVELLGRSVGLSVPTKVTIAGDRLEAAGEFDLTHTDLGMKPFSVMAGALQVADRMTFSYRLRADRAQAEPAR
jgi:polyisoprenoid-binding protein YceI